MAKSTTKGNKSVYGPGGGEVAMTDSEYKKAIGSKKEPKKVTKKAPAKKATSDTERAKFSPFDKKDILTLRKPQYRLLVALGKARGPLTRIKLVDIAKVPYAWLVNWIGQPDAKRRKARESEWGFTSLMSIGFTKCKEIEVAGKKEIGYEITPEGRQAIKDYDAAIKAKASAEKAKAKAAK